MRLIVQRPSNGEGRVEDACEAEESVIVAIPGNCVNSKDVQLRTVSIGKLYISYQGSVGCILIHRESGCLGNWCIVGVRDIYPGVDGSSVGPVADVNRYGVGCCRLEVKGGRNAQKSR